MSLLAHLPQLHPHPVAVSPVLHHHHQRGHVHSSLVRGLSRIRILDHVHCRAGVLLQPGSLEHEVSAPGLLVAHSCLRKHQCNRRGGGEGLQLPGLGVLLRRSDVTRHLHNDIPDLEVNISFNTIGVIRRTSQKLHES